MRDADLPSTPTPDAAAASSPAPAIDRRRFVQTALAGLGTASPLLLAVIRLPVVHGQEAPAGYDPTGHYYGMGIDIEKCIGCGRCVAACKAENEVPLDAHHFNTWVERYVIDEDGDVTVDSPNGGMDGFPLPAVEGGLRRTFFVPKLCNHCANPPCVQVCPVGATFATRDGVVLVDEKYCIGCRYCIQACPYGARWFHPTKHVAAKCTLCYHRIVKGLVPACVEACPTGARTFGEVEQRATPLARFMRMNEVQVLKPHLNTKPKVYYSNLDGEVR